MDELTPDEVKELEADAASIGTITPYKLLVMQNAARLATCAAGEKTDPAAAMARSLKGLQEKLNDANARCKAGAQPQPPFTCN